MGRECGSKPELALNSAIYRLIPRPSLVPSLFEKSIFLCRFFAGKSESNAPFSGTVVTI